VRLGWVRMPGIKLARIAIRTTMESVFPIRPYVPPSVRARRV
jgi:hypothetical protein